MWKAAQSTSDSSIPEDGIPQHIPTKHSLWPGVLWENRTIFHRFGTSSSKNKCNYRPYQSRNESNRGDKNSARMGTIMCRHPGKHIRRHMANTTSQRKIYSTPL
eukprot:10917275-Ditylum_brightwellii.AAC.1